MIHPRVSLSTPATSMVAFFFRFSVTIVPDDVFARQRDIDEGDNFCFLHTAEGNMGRYIKGTEIHTLGPTKGAGGR